MKEREEHIINLDLPINERWSFLKDYKSVFDNKTGNIELIKTGNKE